MGRIYIIIFFLTIHIPGYSQYRIYGYIDVQEKEKIIYLSMLRYNEESAIYPEQVLTSALADSTGYFEITGQLLPDENMLYRIHSNKIENESLVEFTETGENKNYHNFIFSNKDTIFFPEGESIWFNNPRNTNPEDKEWRGAINYELKLIEEYSEARNRDAIIQAEEKFLNEYKLYCLDSLSGSLVKLLGFAHLRRNINMVVDFNSNPGFYYTLLDELNKDYPGASYYNQFRDEFSRLSASIIQQKYTFHKRLNYFLGVAILLLLAGLIYLLGRLRKKKRHESDIELSALTTQEEKIAKLICEGRSNKEIASKLFISLSTVKSHIGSINSKLNVTNRKQLVDKLQIHTRD